MQGVSGAGHRQVVESVERSIPGTLACQSINDDFLITTLRISAARRRQTRRMRNQGRHRAHARRRRHRDCVADGLGPRSAVRDGLIAPDHATPIVAVIHKVPDTVAADEIAAAEKLPADAAGSTTPDELTKVGPNLLAYLHPAGDAPDERGGRC